MAKNQILVSSDHHANWHALEKLFQVANKKQIPFIINGDVVGDYNFNEIKTRLNLRYPYEILRDTLSELTSGLTISTNTMRLQALYRIIIKFHAKKLAELIDKYSVPTYFLLGNHEPINFIKITMDYLKNKNLLIDLGSINKIENVNGIRIAGISNVHAIMPFIYDIYNSMEIDHLFSHQTTERPTLFGNVTKAYIKNSTLHLLDLDWIRIMQHENQQSPNLDIFFTHGQIGTGEWKTDKKAKEMPTLHAAAKLSDLSLVTIDGHLHSTHEMKNPLGVKTLRAVGNSGIILTKNINGSINKELVTVDAEYNPHGAIDLSRLDLKKEILDEILKK